MRKMISLSTLAFLLVFSMSCSQQQAGLPQQDAAKLLRASVSMVIGDVTVLRENIPGKQDVKLNMNLLPDDVILTGEGGKLSIVLEDSGVIRISENSRVILASLFENGEGGKDHRLRVEAGKVVLGLKKLQKHSSFNVETPTAVAGVRGTSFMVDVQDEPQHAFPYFVKLEEEREIVTRVAVLAGAVEFIDAESDDSRMIDSLKQAILVGSDFENVRVVDIDRLALNEMEEIKDFAEIRKLKMDEITEEISEVEPAIREQFQADLRTETEIKKTSNPDAAVSEDQLKEDVEVQEQQIERVNTRDEREGRYLEDQGAW